MAFAKNDRATATSFGSTLAMQHVHAALARDVQVDSAPKAIRASVGQGVRPWLSLHLKAVHERAEQDLESV